MAKRISHTGRFFRHDAGLIHQKPVPSDIDRRVFLAGGLAAFAAPSLTHADDSSETSPPVVVIDAGHGGHDSGAVGATGLLEKTVTLDVAFKLRDLLVRANAHDVVLTREADVFVPLADRLKLAQSRRAHLLISLHADSLSDPSTKGASAYTLAPRASDRDTDELSSRENSETATGQRPYEEHPPEVSVILESLMFREKRAFSVQIQSALLGELEKVVALLRNPARAGNFMVLRSGSIPSVLLEMGFMSNPDDELLLQSSDYRMKIAYALHGAIEACVERFAAAAG